MGQCYEQGAGMGDPTKGFSVRTALRNGLHTDNSQDSGRKTDKNFKLETEGRRLRRSIPILDSNARQKGKSDK